MLLQPLYAFLISITLTLALIIRRYDVSIALGLGVLLYAVLTLNSLNDLGKVTVDLLSVATVNTLLSLIQAMFLADLYRESRVAEKMIDGISCLGDRVAGFITPAIIGLLPMPGGAYISAVLADPLYNRLRLGSDEKTYINYWFRHIWVPTWPLFQNIIMASAILGVSVRDILSINWRITVASILAGVIVSTYIFAQTQRRDSGDKKISDKNSCSLRGVIHLWPFIIISILALVLNIALPIALLITIAMFIAIYKPRDSVILRALKYSLNIPIILLLIEILVFSSLIRETNLASEINRLVSDYLLVAVFIVPLVIGFGTAAEFAYVALAFPPFLTAFHESNVYTVLAFLGGYMGVMLSPSHACLVLSAKYYNSILTKPYRYIIPSVILTVILTSTLLLF